jgi:hypothetical protein
MELLGRNIQIQDDKRTLGELDFIIAREGKVVHVEVAFKYYLAININGSIRYCGPSLRDRLDLKVAKLLKQQLPILDTAHCRARLKESGLPQPTMSEVWLKGQLFENVGAADPASRSEGDSWTWGELKEFETGDQCFWEVLHKPNWFAAQRTQETRFLDFEQLSVAVRENWAQFKQPVLVVRRRKNASFAEISRHFIVPDDWVKRAHEWLK